MSDSEGLFWGENHEKDLGVGWGGAGTVSPERRDASGLMWGKHSRFQVGRVFCVTSGGRDTSQLIHCS